MAKRGRPPHPDILTPRQWEVLDLVRQGLSNPEIGERLGITLAAVKFHVSEILGKLSLSSREEAAAWDPTEPPEVNVRWDPTRRPTWATALAPVGFFWRRLAGGLVSSAGSLAAVTSVVLGVGVVAGITTLAVLLLRDDASSNDATPPAVVVQPTSQAHPAGKIAFYSDRDGHREIYVMNADGSGQTNVSNGPGDDFFGAWSPDGSRIAFHSNRDGNGEVYVVNADGSGLTNVSNSPCEDDMLAWSPDSSRIAFISDPHWRFGGGDNPTVTPAAGDCGATIYVVNADGSGLTNLSNDPGDDSFGSWSPDGSRIAFTSGADGLQRDIYVVNADGSGLTNLSNGPGENSFSNNPGADGTVWSPDSSRIRFTSVREGNLGLYVVNADGSGFTNLGPPGPMICACGTSAGGGWSSDYGWISGGPSPDGSRFAFFSDRDGNEELYVVNADGLGITRLTNNPGSDGNLVWSPDGSRIAFHSDRDGNNEIYIANADGSGETNLTKDPGPDDGPGWSPDGTRIAFITARDGNQEIYVVNADGSGPTNLTNNPGLDRDPVWSPARY